MNSGVLQRNAYRFFLLAALQLLIFNQISWTLAGREVLFVMIYPLAIFLLPLNLPHWAVLSYAGALGLAIDFFSESLGVHAATAVFTGFCQVLYLRYFAPRDGYPSAMDGPNKKQLDDVWFLRYVGILLFIHLLTFFSIQAFSPYFWSEILLKTVISWPASLLVLLAWIYIFNPEEP
jgi:hypothetical protein